jgi:hypothetical protein
MLTASPWLPGTKKCSPGQSRGRTRGANRGCRCGITGRFDVVPGLVENKARKPLGTSGAHCLVAERDEGFGNAAPGMVGNGFTIGGMSMVITLTIPDETARQIEAVAVTRGTTIEEVAAATLIEHTPPVVLVRRRRLGFVGAGSSGDTRPTDIHQLRREIADQATA